MSLDVFSSNRILIFFSITMLLFILEYIAPYSRRKYRRQDRWFSNFGIGLINGLILYILLPAGAVGISLFAESYQLGLLYHVRTDNSMIQLLMIMTCVIFLDYTIYLQHVMFHKIPWLWPFHAMHHSDEELDVSSAVRFHPIEVLLSLIYKGMIIILLGIPVLAVMIFEVLLSSSALYTHANIKLPNKINRFLEYIFVTPKMHLLHHSIKISQQNSNYGFFLSIWDRLSNTYIPNDNYDLTIGLKKYQKGEYKKLTDMVKQPFQLFRTFWKANKKENQDN